MRPVLDYSRDLKRKLTEGKTMDAALSELRAAGVSILDCIVTVRAFRGCDLPEAKRIVESSPAWGDVRGLDLTDDFLQGLSALDQNERTGSRTNDEGKND